MLNNNVAKENQPTPPIARDCLCFTSKSWKTPLSPGQTKMVPKHYQKERERGKKRMTEGQTFKCRSAKWSVFAAVVPSSFSQQKTKNHSSLSLPPLSFQPSQNRKDTLLLSIDSETTAGLAAEVATTTTQPVRAFGVGRPENVTGDHLSPQGHPKAQRDNSKLSVARMCPQPKNPRALAKSQESPCK